MRTNQPVPATATEEYILTALRRIETRLVKLMHQNGIDARGEPVHKKTDCPNVKETHHD